MNTWGYPVLHSLESAADLVVVCLSPGRLCDCAEVKPISTRLQGPVSRKSRNFSGVFRVT